ncbi:leucine rich repeat containing 45 [Trypanosoma rangeli]|uniref:Leucine rich repeat containing 45 n=1 Tax=Trypanosoma rangeli TaxID=5698 RepID=A0A422N2Q3_TRYRA|nr:leucine rich repeat containing 45 [Trypanosoma rangeli]RNE99744.1 leucine rich repeat containing 45 [Trypanosoma rangeli]|eukprot:RNE99744.1 leucine rich repeat containing 45 [Trypanosoma rangeli]
MPEPDDSAVQERVANDGSNANSGHCLEVFLAMYASQCKKSATEMNPRALQAAVAMQEAIDQSKREVSDTGINAIGATYTLHAVPLGLSGSQTLFPSIACMPLVKLDLTDCYLGDAGTRTLAELLSTSSRCGHVMRVIYLGGVGITDASPLACFVTAAYHLQLLDVSRNRIGTQPHGLAVLCAAMQHHKSIREVNLSDNLISGSCTVSVRAIAEWVVCAGHGDVLHRIDLRFNTMGMLREVGGVAVPATTKVTRLIYGTHSLVDALLFNNTLESLELYGNALSADVLDVVGAKLAVNKRTKEILRKSLAQVA